ncbi:MAG: Holliday junction branch migration protein RuvA [Candidatus Accumulibacter sp.]|uniref:Holliday junction branch migration protein RuvA n=1 Tax=Accumulibacter sp. TaxID=2053492 RepID=UPI002878195F|nr:Holliday junction branch migration protein RuvA [Accumulibacter sp.]MDS4014609.1 Holliday junction branch migration protein RuvA [Accumulibacter sp.]
MIGRLSGILAEKNPPQVVVDVQGVGYELEVPMSTYYNLPANGDRVVLLTHFVVREDGHFLYGFATEGERLAFRHLLKVSGVGPRLALAVLSGLSVNDLSLVIARQEVGRLTKVPGIGTKTAERLLLELKGKLPDALLAAGAAAPEAARGDILNALLALGYNDREAAAALKQLPADVSTAEGIRQALRLLSRV